MSIVRIGESYYYSFAGRHHGERTGRVRYQVDTAAAAELYVRSPKFRQALLSGEFLHAEERFCLNHPPYIRDGRLTRRAREHPEECCVGFTDCFLRPLPMGSAAYSSHARYTLELANLPQDFTARLLHRHQDAGELLTRLPVDFSGTARMLIKEMGYTQVAVAELLDVDVSTSYRFFHSKKPKKNMVYALGFLLKLDAPLFDDLVRKAGLSYAPTPMDNLVQMLRGICPNPGLLYCNRVLSAAGCEKLPSLPE